MERNFELIKKFFEKLKCARCDNFFSGDAIQPVRMEENNVVVRISCLHCGKNLGLAILGVDKNEYKNSLKFSSEDDEFLRAKDMPSDPITYEDVIEAHKFFSGLGADWMKYLPGEERE